MWQVMTQANRKAFIDDSITFLRQHGFDGIDLHWMFPTQRGGNQNDKARYSSLCAVCIKVQ